MYVILNATFSLWSCTNKKEKKQGLFVRKIDIFFNKKLPPKWNKGLTSWRSNHAMNKSFSHKSSYSFFPAIKISREIKFCKLRVHKNWFHVKSGRQIFPHCVSETHSYQQFQFYFVLFRKSWTLFFVKIFNYVFFSQI